MKPKPNLHFALALIALFAGLLLCAPLVGEPQVPNHPQPSRITAEAWRTARLDIRTTRLEAKIDYLLDRAEIEDIITTYAYSVDTRTKNKGKRAEPKKRTNERDGASLN